MPFTSYKLNLDPETLQAAQKAFDLGWAAIRNVPDGYDLQLARDLLAERIMERALEQGERDPERLKAYARRDRFRRKNVDPLYGQARAELY